MIALMEFEKTCQRLEKEERLLDISGTFASHHNVCPHWSILCTGRCKNGPVNGIWNATR